MENLQGASLLASELERDILPARIADYRPDALDTLMASGQVVWVGLEQIGNRDGRIALYLSESLPLLLPPSELRGDAPTLSERALNIADFLAKNGASFFAAIHAGSGGGFPGETRDALWELAWSGRITNDTFHPLRDLLRTNESKRERSNSFAGAQPGSPDFIRRFRARSEGQAQGRWSLIRPHLDTPITATQWSANMAQQLLLRHGIVLRETAIAENVPRGYATIYPALKTMEDSGWVRRGMFVAGLGAAQFAMPAAVDMLRSLRSEPDTPEVLFLAATDPANLYGTVLPWPRRQSGGLPDSPEDTPTKAEIQLKAETQPKAGSDAPPNVDAIPANTADSSTSRSMSRTSGAGVILINGVLAAFLRRRSQEIQVFLPDAEPLRSQFARELARKLADLAIRRQGRKTGLLVGSINGEPAREHLLARFLEESGFVNTAAGFQMRRIAPLAFPDNAFPDKAMPANDAPAAESADSDAGELDADEHDGDITELA
jgi:ATP-dependent Lhr-like helicase